MIYISTVIEEDDDLSEYRELELRCKSGSTLLSYYRWSLDKVEQLYTMWFDLKRITNLHMFEQIPLRAEVLLTPWVAL